ncbi:MAG TPA: sugar phosphate isomerase/epimerase family protein [Armatimonadota bacterium]|jgi:sugar phosphate isomerase/epimerase|nr:sugar phosphate isomerase/epimerase family protein [Armatimonadota bacterium]HOM83560.1 sugar phosphate isomerase/epimerase family protein [Armatimonadota bacterium]HOQ28542.1 sugar phosphate isomerase/epimerase family protein [Armatimonadota bacterium]HPO72781.1 sugar phosphate isomerase/epimerase family protein [Armatimonadota bacterium]
MDLVFPAWASDTHQSLLEALPAMAAQGVTRVEWGLGNPDYFDAKDAAQVAAVRQVLADTGIRAVALHAPFGEQADLASLESRVREVTIACYVDAINVARQVGARYLVVHAGHGPCNDRLAQRLLLARESLCALEPVARMAGVVLALENLPPGYPGSAAGELLDTLDAIGSPCVGICFDTGHAHLAGHLPATAGALLPRAVMIHLHDNDGAEDQHLLPGCGAIDWGEFARIYQETGCTAPATLECSPPDGWGWDRCSAAVRELLGIEEIANGHS